MPRFEKARQLSPSDPHAALYLGLTLESLGQPAQALSLYDEAARLERSKGGLQEGTLLPAARHAGNGNAGPSVGNKACCASSILVVGVRMIIGKTFLAGLALSASLVAFDGNGFAEKFERLPQAVKDTAKANMENAFPVSIIAAKGEQGWDYQVNTRVDGKFHDLVIDESGKLVAVKDETELASIPAAARSVIEKQAAVGKIITLEKVTEGGQVSYGVVVNSQKSNVQFRVAADGTVKSKNEAGK